MELGGQRDLKVKENRNSAKLIPPHCNFEKARPELVKAQSWSMETLSLSNHESSSCEIELAGNRGED